MNFDDALIDLFFSLKPEYRQNATFVMTSATLADARKLQNDAGFLWQPNMGAAVDQNDGNLLGRPVVVSENMGVHAASPLQHSVLCGDFNAGYELVRIANLTVLRDPFTTKGKTLFYVSARFAGRNVDNDAVKALLA